MPDDSPATEVHRHSPAGGATGCLAVSSAVVGILLLVAGPCTLVLAPKGGLEPSIWVLAVVLIVAGLALLAGAFKIMSAAKGADANGLPSRPAAALPAAADGAVGATAGAAPERAPQPRDVRDIGGGLIIIGLIILLVFAFLLVTQLR